MNKISSKTKQKKQKKQKAKNKNKIIIKKEFFFLLSL